MAQTRRKKKKEWKVPPPPTTTAIITIGWSSNEAWRRERERQKKYTEKKILDNVNIIMIIFAIYACLTFSIKLAVCIRLCRVQFLYFFLFFVFAQSSLNKILIKKQLNCFFTLNVFLFSFLHQMHSFSHFNFIKPRL